MSDADTTLAVGEQSAAPSYDIAASYIAALTGDDPAGAVVDFRCLHDTDRSAPGHARRGTLPQWWDWIVAMQSTGHGAFVAIQQLDGHGRLRENVAAIRCHAVDLDGIDAQQQYEAAAAWSPAPSFAVSTSPGRFHVYWCVAPYAALDYAESIQRRLRVQFNGDKAVIDPTRVLRLAGTVNFKRNVPHLVTCHALAGIGQRIDAGQLDMALTGVLDLAGGTGDRHALGDPARAAPSLEWVRYGLSRLDPNDLSRPDWIATLAAAKQAAWTHGTPEQVEALLLEFCSRYKGDDPAEDRKQIASIRNTELGWQSLVRRIPALRATVSFGQQPVAVTAPAGAGGAVVPTPQPVDFWATFNADDTAKSSAVVCTRTLAESGIPIEWDEFADRLMITAHVPWRDAATSYPVEWNDNDTHGCKALLEMSFIKPSKETVFDSVRYIAGRNKRHPVRDYLNLLIWDGTERLPMFLPQYFGAPDNDYSRTIGAKWMIAAVARIMEPGCKVDTILTLEDEQGKRKSTALRKLLPNESWFTDNLSDLKNKDAQLQLRGKWIIELAELDTLSRAEVRTIKAYASRQTDNYRPPYGRASIDVPRQCVFAGTTNEETYLEDQTGNRRWWPVRCGTVDIAAITQDRDLLWAEALHRYRVGEQWWLDDAAEKLAKEEQEARRVVDPWEEIVSAKLAMLENVTPDYVCEHVLGIPFERYNRAVNSRIANALRHAGFERKQVRDDNGKRRWCYYKAG